MSILSICVRFEVTRGQQSLFDLDVDPFELTNVYDDPFYATTVASLEERLAVWRNVSFVEDIQAARDSGYWNDQGGLVPWVNVEPTPSPKPSRPTAVARPGAPNLVFIMMDDGESPNFTA